MLVNERTDLLSEASRLAKLCETLCTKCMKAKQTNEVMGLKFHYLSHVLKYCAENKDDLESAIKK